MKDFKIRVFQEVERLIDSMDQGTLTDEKILSSMNAIADEFQISFGQAQKPINVILKVHFYHTRKEDDKIRDVLHCPLDSVVLKELKKMDSSFRPIPLKKIGKEKYVLLQQQIGNYYSPRIGLDDKWDEQHLSEEGLLGDS